MTLSVALLLTAMSTSSVEAEVGVRTASLDELAAAIDVCMGLPDDGQVAALTDAGWSPTVEPTEVTIGGRSTMVNFGWYSKADTGMTMAPGDAFGCGGLGYFRSFISPEDLEVFVRDDLGAEITARRSPNNLVLSLNGRVVRLKASRDPEVPEVSFIVAPRKGVR